MNTAKVDQVLRNSAAFSGLGCLTDALQCGREIKIKQCAC
jgi:hypothetical protein